MLLRSAVTHVRDHVLVIYSHPFFLFMMLLRFVLPFFIVLLSLLFSLEFVGCELLSQVIHVQEQLCPTRTLLVVELVIVDTQCVSASEHSMIESVTEVRVDIWRHLGVEFTGVIATRRAIKIELKTRETTFLKGKASFFGSMSASKTDRSTELKTSPTANNKRSIRVSLII